MWNRRLGRGSSASVWWSLGSLLRSPVHSTKAQDLFPPSPDSAHPLEDRAWDTVCVRQQWDLCFLLWGPAKGFLLSQFMPWGSVRPGPRSVGALQQGPYLQQVQGKCCSCCCYRSLTYQPTGFPSWTFARATLLFILSLKFSIIWNVFAAVSWALGINSSWLLGLICYKSSQRTRGLAASCPHAGRCLWVSATNSLALLPTPPWGRKENLLFWPQRVSSEWCYQKVTGKKREVVFMF